MIKYNGVFILKFSNDGNLLPICLDISNTRYRKYMVRGQTQTGNVIFKATPHDPCGLQKVGAVDYAALP